MNTLDKFWLAAGVLIIVMIACVQFDKYIELERQRVEIARDQWFMDKRERMLELEIKLNSAVPATIAPALLEKLRDMQ